MGRRSVAGGAGPVNSHRHWRPGPRGGVEPRLPRPLLKGGVGGAEASEAFEVSLRARKFPSRRREGAGPRAKRRGSQGCRHGPVSPRRSGVRRPTSTGPETAAATPGLHPRAPR